MKIVVIGAGAWGTAVAMTAAAHPAGHDVTLWARDAAQASAMQTGAATRMESKASNTGGMPLGSRAVITL